MTINKVYAEHRARSLVYYWMALLDANDPTSKGFTEIFSDSIELFLGESIYRDEKSFLTWFVGNCNRLLKSVHEVEQFSLRALKDASYQINFEAAWCGQLKATPDIFYEGRTQHEWLIVDNPAESFARIQRIKVATITPFQPTIALSFENQKCSI